MIEFPSFTVILWPVTLAIITVFLILWIFNFLFVSDIYIDENKQCYKDLGFKRYEETWIFIDGPWHKHVKMLKMFLLFKLRYNAVNVIPAAMGKNVREIASKVFIAHDTLRL